MSHSMQCPRCHRAVTVAAGSASRRVKCPHCQQPFKVPGSTEAASDEDDWLQLDEAPPPRSTPGHSSPAKPATPGSHQPPPKSQGGDSSPDLSEKDRAILAHFDHDFEEPTGEADGSDLRPNPAGSSDDVLWDELPPVQPAAGSQPPPTAEPPPEYASEYRVKCPLCGSILYATAEQEGNTIKCSDCYHQIKVPPPPKIHKKVPLDLDRVETFNLGGEHVRERATDPFRKSAQELLDAAEQEDVEETNPDYDTPKISDWARSVFGIFFQSAVTVYWIILSLIAAIPAAIALSSGHPMVILALFPAGFFFATLVIAWGFTILESVSNDEESVTEWPELLDPTEWMAPLFISLAALALPAIPAWILGQVIFGPGLAAVCLTMISIYLLFPFVLLSMLDMQSVLMPFSPEVARSVTRCEESWGGFYFSSGLLFFALFMIYIICEMFSPPVGAMIGIFATVGVAFTYFAMLGRLAYSIGQSVNEPPMQNEIDRTRRSESR